ncbi:MAG: STAS domain-containing protein [bacterium]|nr:MAG: STAS domain-containing protein [bacterium]
MGFIKNQQKGVTIIKIEDERLDSRIAPQLKSELLFLASEGTKNVLIDLSDVSYADSSGLGAFLFGIRQMKNIGGELKLFAANDRIMSLVRIARLSGILLNYHKKEEAISSFEEE